MAQAVAVVGDGEPAGLLGERLLPLQGLELVGFGDLGGDHLEDPVREPAQRDRVVLGRRTRSGGPRPSRRCSTGSASTPFTITTACSSETWPAAIASRTGSWSRSRACASSRRRLASRLVCRVALAQWLARVARPPACSAEARAGGGRSGLGRLGAEPRPRLGRGCWSCASEAGAADGSAASGIHGVPGVSSGRQGCGIHRRFWSRCVPTLARWRAGARLLDHRGATLQPRLRCLNTHPYRVLLPVVTSGQYRGGHGSAPVGTRRHLLHDRLRPPTRWPSCSSRSRSWPTPTG